MPASNPADIGGRNVAAFLDVLAFTEGSDNSRQRTMQRGYDVIVGGSLMTGFTDHPRKLIALPKLGMKSSGAGRYKFLRATWDTLAARLKLPDFSPKSQDRACVELLRECGALLSLVRGDFDRL